jgi:hypothetical protein
MSDQESGGSLFDRAVSGEAPTEVVFKPRYDRPPQYTPEQLAEVEARRDAARTPEARIARAVTELAAIVDGDTRRDRARRMVPLGQLPPVLLGQWRDTLKTHGGLPKTDFDKVRKDSSNGSRRRPAAGSGGEPPVGVDPAEWVETTSAGRLFGTDGAVTYEWDREHGYWRILVSSNMRITDQRSAAPDPDFPDRAEDGDDAAALEASADVIVTTRRGESLRPRIYRNVSTSDLRRLTPLDQYGITAWRDSGGTRDSNGLLLRAFLSLSHEQGGGLSEGVFYPVTGWYPSPAGRGEMFVHGGGAIDGGGRVADVEIRLGDQFDGLRLGDPVAGAELVEGFVEHLALIESGAMPARILIPLTGASLRPLFGIYADRADTSAEAASSANAWLSGDTGSVKSGGQAAAHNCVYPGLLYNAYPFKAGTSRNGGGSSPGIERLGFRARDLCLPFDDLDPSEPEAARAAWQSNLIRSAAGGYSRLLAVKSGSGNRASMPWRAGLVGNGEPLDAEASAENRVVNVPMAPGDVRVTELARQTKAPERNARGRLGAGVVRALAVDRPRYRAMLDAARDVYRPMFVGAEAPGPVARGAATFAELAATLRVVLVILVEQGMSTADARRHWAVIRNGLREAWWEHRRIIESGGRASRSVEYLRQALDSGALRINDKAQPDDPSRDRLGYEQRSTPAGADGVVWAGAGQPVEAMARAVGGWQDAETGDLYLMPAIAHAAVRQVANDAGDSWTGSTKTLAGSLLAGGYLHVTEGARKNGDATTTPRIGGRVKRVWHVLAEKLDGETGNAGGVDYSGPVDPSGLPHPEVDGDQPEPAAAPAVEPEPAAAPAVEPEPEAAPVAEVPTQLALGPAPVAIPSAAELRELHPWLSRTGRTGRPVHPAENARRQARAEHLAASLAALPEVHRDERGIWTPSLHVLDALVGPYQPQRLATNEQTGKRYRRGPLERPEFPGAIYGAHIPTVHGRHNGEWHRAPGYSGPALVLDASGAWVTSASSAQVAHGALVHTGPGLPAAGQVGYHSIPVFPWLEADTMPDPLGNVSRDRSELIVATPTLAILMTLVNEGRWPDFEPLDNWTGIGVKLNEGDWTHYITALRAFAIQNYGRDSVQYEAVKDSYAMCITMMRGSIGNSQSDKRRYKTGLQRRDWPDFIEAQAHANMFRAADKCLKLGVGPVAIRQKDELVIPADGFEVVTAMPRGGRPAIMIDQDGIRPGTFKTKSAPIEWPVTR